MVHGSETWPLKVRDINRIFRADKIMIGRMCNAILKDCRSSDKLRYRLKIPDITGGYALIN